MTEEKTQPPEWKTDATDPFALPISDQPKKEPLVLPIPELNLAENEKNKIQKELLREIEKKCLQAHAQLVFFSRDEFSRNDLAQYSPQEAEEIIRTKSRLNEEQTAATLKCERDLFIQALAGTGKTSLLSACISYLLAIGTDPEKIAISSHTVTAAEEIKNRIFPTLEALFPATKAAMGNLKPSTGTIHALAYREMIFHKHPKSRWTILDEAQQYRIWKESSLFAFPERAGLNQSDEAAGEEMRLFDRIRGYDIPESNVPDVLKLVSNSEDLPKIAAIYQKIKEARKLLDYTDLLREWAPILIHPGYKNKWDYFFVDEFQDTNPLQKFLLKLLKYSGAKLVVCGDNRQSINSFTGSDPTSHTEFFSDFGIQEAWLETNYRCSQEIIALANEVIAHMMPPEKGRLKAHAGAPIGTATKFVLTKSAKDKRNWVPKEEAEKEKRQEAQITCQEAADLYEILAKEAPEDDKPSVAILYRTNAQGSLLEEIMAAFNASRQKDGLPAVKYVRKDFRRTALRNKTEREVLNTLSSWCAPQLANWESLLQSPYFHGIGEVTARNIQRKADRQKPRNIEETAAIFERELSRRNAETIGEFFLAWENVIVGLGSEEEPPVEKACTALAEWIQKIAEAKTYEKGSKKESEEAQRRAYESGIFDRVRQKGTEGKKLSEAIAEVAEENERAAMVQNNANRALALTDQGGKQEKEDGLILSTIHLAKGREYEGVVIHQVSRGSLPHFNSLKFYDNPKNTREKGFRKFASFPALQTEALDYNKPDETLPKIWRTGIPVEPPKNPVEEWEDHNNPLEEEKRLLYVAITRAKKRLVITSKDHNYQFLPKNLWEKLKRGEKFLVTP